MTVVLGHHEHPGGGASNNSTIVQGDKPPVDIKIKVLFYYEANVPKGN